MITKDEILNTIFLREIKLEKWLNNNPEKKSLKQLEDSFTKWKIDIIQARKMSATIQTKSKFNLCFMYVVMNELSAYRAHDIISSFYIQKLKKL